MLVILCTILYLCFFFFFKQKTAYEMRISDWSSDVCSSDLDPVRLMTAYQLPLYDIDFALKEVERLAKDKKARCVQLTPFPSELGLPDFYDPRYAPLWSLIEESGLTILNHLALSSKLWDVFRRDPTPQKGIFTGLAWAPLAETI